MSFTHLSSIEQTDVGRKRKNNEDSVLRIPSVGVFCVADGMGGAEGGELASQAVVQILQEDLAKAATASESLPLADKTKAIRAATNRASAWIRAKADERGVTGMGTTAVILAFDPDNRKKAVFLHAGDSRAYCYRGKKNFKQVTKDHSLAAAAGIGKGKPMPAMFKGVLTRAVGLKPEVELDETRVTVKEGDIFLLCSDGLSGMLSDDRMTELFRDHASEGLPALAGRLVDEANEAGGKDNISVVLVQSGSGPASAVPAAKIASTDTGMYWTGAQTSASAASAFDVGSDNPPTDDSAGDGLQTGETMALGPDKAEYEGSSDTMQGPPSSDDLALPSDESPMHTPAAPTAATLADMPDDVPEDATRPYDIPGAGTRRLPVRVLVPVLVVVVVLAVAGVGGMVWKQRRAPTEPAGPPDGIPPVADVPGTGPGDAVSTALQAVSAAGLEYPGPAYVTALEEAWTTLREALEETADDADAQAGLASIEGRMKILPVQFRSEVERRVGLWDAEGTEALLEEWRGMQPGLQRLGLSVDAHATETDHFLRVAQPLFRAREMGVLAEEELPADRRFAAWSRVSGAIQRASGEDKDVERVWAPLLESVRVRQRKALQDFAGTLQEAVRGRDPASSLPLLRAWVDTTAELDPVSPTGMAAADADARVISAVQKWLQPEVDRAVAAATAGQSVPEKVLSAQLLPLCSAHPALAAWHVSASNRVVQARGAVAARQEAQAALQARLQAATSLASQAGLGSVRTALAQLAAIGRENRESLADPELKSSWIGAANACVRSLVKQLKGHYTAEDGLATLDGVAAVVASPQAATVLPRDTREQLAGAVASARTVEQSKRSLQDLAACFRGDDMARTLDGFARLAVTAPPRDSRLRSLYDQARRDGTASLGRQIDRAMSERNGARIESISDALDGQDVRAALGAEVHQKLRNRIAAWRKEQILHNIVSSGRWGELEESLKGVTTTRDERFLCNRWKKAWDTVRTARILDAGKLAGYFREIADLADRAGLPLGLRVEDILQDGGGAKAADRFCRGLYLREDRLLSLARAKQALYESRLRIFGAEPLATLRILSECTGGRKPERPEQIADSLSEALGVVHDLGRTLGAAVRGPIVTGRGDVRIELHVVRDFPLEQMRKMELFAEPAWGELIETVPLLGEWASGAIVGETDADRKARLASIRDLVAAGTWNSESPDLRAQQETVDRVAEIVRLVRSVAGK